MELSDLLHGLRRAPWMSVGRHILLRAGFDTSRGYERSVNTILRDPEDEQKIAEFAIGLIEHLVAGEKLVQLIKVSPAELHALRTWVQGKRRSAGPLTDAFPGIATKEDIKANSNQPLKSAGAVDLEIGIAALFTASRAYIQRVELSLNDLKAAAAEGFEKVVGYQRVYIQTYEAIWVPPQGEYVCLAVDYPQGLPLNFVRESVAQLQHLTRQQLGRSIQLANFWPAVDGLYEAADGKLVDYGFSIDGQSVNHHKARRKSQCLRKAVYDAAGAAAVTAAGNSLDLFKVAMQWTRRHPDGVDVDPEVLIPGAAADLNKVAPTVNHVILRDCLSSSDLDFVVSKLQPHLA